MDTLELIARKLYEGKADEVAELTRQALQEQIPPSEVLRGGLIAGMNKVARDFSDNVLYVPEVLVAGRAMHAGMNVIRPLLAKGKPPLAGTFVIGTVQGDVHDIGKNLVAMMMEGAGFRVVDLGVDVEASRFVEAVRDVKPDVLGLSALLSTTMVEMGRVIQAISQACVKDTVKIVVGGAPVTQAYADSIGADGYAPDGASAVAVCRSLLGRGR
jgi:5-methyltetrahydrofolate--homocysteine methyltransferase